jgi:glutamine synthetase type III
MQQPDLITTFVAELLTKAGLNDVPKSFYEEYSQKIGVEAQKRLGMIAIRELTPEAVDEFGKLMTSEADPKEMAEFFQKNIPDYEQKVTDALKEFADEFLASAEKLKASV